MISYRYCEVAQEQESTLCCKDSFKAGLSICEACGVMLNLYYVT